MSLVQASELFVNERGSVEGWCPARLRGFLGVAVWATGECFT